MTEKALEGVRVFDLSEGIVGPHCTRLLGNYGAEVIKLEKPGVGDKSRKVALFPHDIPHPEKSALFLHLNINKKSITLSLKTATSRKIAKELVERVDVLVESLNPGHMREWGLDYESLEKINRKLNMTSITPFGQTGPYRDYKVTSAVLDALGGHTYNQGEPKREPLRYLMACGRVHRRDGWLPWLLWELSTMAQILARDSILISLYLNAWPGWIPIARLP